LIGVRSSRIEDNKIVAAVRATRVARPGDACDAQAVVLRQASGVVLRGNTLEGGFTSPDAVSQTGLLGLQATTQIKLDGHLLRDVPEQPPVTAPK
jgi:hypothetical protein